MTLMPLYIFHNQMIDHDPLSKCNYNNNNNCNYKLKPIRFYLSFISMQHLLSKSLAGFWTTYNAQTSDHKASILDYTHGC